uniref:Zinc finger MYM-type protein 3 isoform X3 n=1 Tax=Geotrypetes seraphini TaxID=260995 RepID=A0A6P8QUQ6_GEOSA|nr:zinc finger MYM-type protein 3 isoform X3 [Geotrypetes seraphini]
MNGGRPPGEKKACKRQSSSSMDSTEFFDPLALTDKPLSGNLPSDMQFGEDLLGSRATSPTLAQPLESGMMEQPKHPVADSALTVLGKPNVLDILEKPKVRDVVETKCSLLTLDKSESLGIQYKARSSKVSDNQNGSCVTVSPHREDMGDAVCTEGVTRMKTDPECGQQYQDGTPSIAHSEIKDSSPLPDEVALAPSGKPADPPQPSLTTERKTRLRTSLGTLSSTVRGKQSTVQLKDKVAENDVSPAPHLEQSTHIKAEQLDNGEVVPQNETTMPKLRDLSGKSCAVKENLLPLIRSLEIQEEGHQAEKGSEPPKEYKRSERVRRTEAVKADSVGPSETMQLSDEDSDAMVDDPNDEDFVPFRSRRPTRMSLRAQLAQRSARTSITKMTCAHCRTPLQKGQTAYQRKGQPQLFCSSACLTAFSKKPLSRKICAFCKKEIVNSRESVMAQTGSGGSFREFCTSACLSLYEAQQQKPAAETADTPDIIKCSMCHKPGEIQHEVSNGNVVHRLCSDACFTRFRATKGLKTNCCDNCGIYIYNKGLPLEYLFHEGQQKRFCNSMCLNSYKKKNTKVYPCMWCKTLCKNFEMLSNVDRNGRMGLFCSICCITSHKVKQSALIGPARPCSLCRRSLSEPAYYNNTERVVYQFCSPSCWTKFQRTSPEGGIHLNCHYCHNVFTGKPEVLDWQDRMYQFCCKDCSEDYKRLHGVVSQCEYCKQEKLLHEKIRFSGVEKNFCSEGCVLLYKQDFTKNLGLCCITCTYCSQTCQRAVTEELDGSTWDFCSEDCKSKYLLWYFKAARCHACKRQGKLLETIHWRGEIKHFCNQQCLLRFYNQQNQPNLDTQKGPESLLNSKRGQSTDPKAPAATQKRPENNTVSDNNLKELRADIERNMGDPAKSIRRKVLEQLKTTRRGVPKQLEQLEESTPKPCSVQVTSPAPPSPPPPPVPTTGRKNKAAMCKPLMQNRGISCKVEMKTKECQTEEDWKPQVIVLPVPVPIFVPVPMHLYCQKVPVPLSMPVPVPVPMFLPTTLESADKIVQTIEELKVKIPSNPLEADILAMAEMIAEAEELDKASSDLCDLASNQSAEGLLEDCDLFGPARDDVLAMAVKMANVLDEPGQDLEADFPKNPLDINPSVDFLFDCGLVGPDDVSTEQEMPRTLRKGNKRLIISESCSRDSLSIQPSCQGLNYSYGINAWKSWVQTKYSSGETTKFDELRFGPKPMQVKEDILVCTAAELNYGLAQFVKEITRPNGEHYDPDSIYYLCLGIQQFLLENNRMVNIFTDLCYLTFVQELNKILAGWQPTTLPNNLIFSRVEEQHLWECKQLGVYSPFVLLNTLMFFNTKFFGLRTAEEHMQLSFTNVVRQSRKCTTNRGTVKMVSIRYYAPVRQKKGREGSSAKRKREQEMPVLEQRENRMNPLRCPVKFYEFYLSKCPENLRNRHDLFYLQPERSCTAESPLWYSVIPMDKSTLEIMLNRILAVREIYEEPHRGHGMSENMD